MCAITACSYAIGGHRQYVPRCGSPGVVRPVLAAALCRACRRRSRGPRRRPPLSSAGGRRVRAGTAALALRRHPPPPWRHPSSSVVLGRLARRLQISSGRRAAQRPRCRAKPRNTSPATAAPTSGATQKSHSCPSDAGAAEHADAVARAGLNGGVAEGLAELQQHRHGQAHGEGRRSRTRSGPLWCPGNGHQQGGAEHLDAAAPPASGTWMTEFSPKPGGHRVEGRPGVGDVRDGCAGSRKRHRAQHGAHQLCSHVGRRVRGPDAAGNGVARRDSGIEVAAGDVPEGQHRRGDREPGGQGRGERVRLRNGEQRHAQAGDHHEERPDRLGGHPAREPGSRRIVRGGSGSWAVAGVVMVRSSFAWGQPAVCQRSLDVRWTLAQRPSAMAATALAPSTMMPAAAQRIREAGGA